LQVLEISLKVLPLSATKGAQFSDRAGLFLHLYNLTFSIKLGIPCYFFIDAHRS
jgi:hypothetical protein